jgi:hypothetical protein
VLQFRHAARRCPRRKASTPADDAGQFTIQGMPNWSTHMPKPLEKKVLPNGAAAFG